MADVELIHQGEVVWGMSGAPGNVLAAVNEELYHGPASAIRLTFNDNLLTDEQVLFVCGVYEAHLGLQRLDSAVGDADLLEGCWESYDYLNRLIRQLGA